MTAEATVYFETGVSANEIVSCLMELPEAICPVYFAEDERKVIKSNVLSDESRFQKFVTENPDGFYLYAGNKKNSIDVSTWSDDCTEVVLWLETSSSKNLVVTFIKALAKFNPVFGFACATDEYYHRNRYYTKIGVNKIESWIGRRLDRYIPGVYWITLLSDELLGRHNVLLSNLSGEAIVSEVFGDGSLHFLQFFENADEWKDNAERLDHLCEQIDGIFSKKFVEVALSEIDDLEKYYDEIDEWR